MQLDICTSPLDLPEAPPVPRPSMFMTPASTAFLLRSITTSVQYPEPHLMFSISMTTVPKSGCGYRA